MPEQPTLKEVAQPTQPEETPVPDIPKEERLEQLQERLVEYDSAMEETRTQLETLRKSLRKMDVDDSAEVSKILDGLPSETPSGVIEKIYKLSRPKRSQLQGNISKMQISLEVLGKKRTLAMRGIKEIEKQIDEERYDDETREICDQYTKALRIYVEAEEVFDTLKEMISKAGDPLFFKRCVRLGYPVSYEVSFDSHLRASDLSGINITEWAERVAGLGNSYGPPLLQKRMDRQQDVALRRAEFMPEHAMFGKQ